ncbi:MAG: peptide chain release factor N(5)-glutamine methyltransferase [Deltaproteobacteria bacterium]|nr:peptide chain release factor N(5)-glutamine methyltransferase [Deltaproteobacteria bacterium]
MSEPSSQRRRDWTILEVLGWTTQRFAERGLASPRLDAELLIAHALGAKRIELYTRSTDLLTAEQLTQIREVVRRRQEGESVAYITGEKEFWGLPFKVNANVLVPRPDTETLVEAALERLPKDEARRVLDVGTGSGAIAISVAKARPLAQVVAIDKHEAALVVAQENAARNQVSVSFLQGDLLAPLADKAEPQPFDLILANLPYIPTADIAALAPEVRREPLSALDGGADGLDLIRTLLSQAPAWLCPGGMVLLELGQGQAGSVAELCEKAGFTSPFVLKDLAGIERVVGAVHGEPQPPPTTSATSE